MEAELLREMIADRDQRIEKIKRKTEEQLGKELLLREQLEEVTGQVAEQMSTLGAERASLLQERTKMLERLGQMNRDFRQQGVSLQTYCKDPLPAASKIDPSYVMRMQAQLCKAMHSLGITDHQMDLAQKESDSIIKYQKEQVALCTDERTKTELILMNELIAKDNERREAEAIFTAKLAKITKEREALERQIEENGGESDEEKDEAEDEEEDNEEEKEAKEDFMKLLTERRAEIERLEQLQEEQEELITEMEEQLKEMEADGESAHDSTLPVAPAKEKTSAVTAGEKALAPPAEEEEAHAPSAEEEAHAPSAEEEAHAPSAEEEAHAPSAEEEASEESDVVAEAKLQSESGDAEAAPMDQYGSTDDEEELNSEGDSHVSSIEEGNNKDEGSETADQDAPLHPNEKSASGENEES